MEVFKMSTRRVLNIGQKQILKSISDKRKSRLAALTMSICMQLSVCQSVMAVEPFCHGGTAQDPAVIWCDDFDDATPINQKYFDYDSDEGDFVPVTGSGVNGSTAMQVKWQPGEVDAGSMKRTFGRNPVNSLSHSNTDFKEIYWRVYLKTDSNWSGNPYKLSRATILANNNWAQAIIAHLWGDGVGDAIMIDPASGIDQNGNLITRTWNDFAHLRWLGSKRGATPIFSSGLAGKWYCIETHVKLNSIGSSDGVFEFWVNNNLEAQIINLKWVGAWQDFGINLISFENYWNPGAPGDRTRFLDNIVISTKRIGCINTVTPAAPKNLR
jgi:hypothetical protein